MTSWPSKDECSLRNWEGVDRKVLCELPVRLFRVLPSRAKSKVL